MRNISAVCLFMALGFSANTAFAQGEADPGFASTGSMRTASGLKIDEYDYENQRAHFSLGHTIAKGERDIRLNISQLEVRMPLFGLYSGGYFDFKLPIFAAGGELANTWGLADASFSYTHMFTGLEDWTIQGTAGLQIGMGTANKTDGKPRPLPMAYQASRGATDVFVGGSVTWKKYVSGAVGYQQPFYRYNENDYFAANQVNDTLYSSQAYAIARKLYRQGDVMMRLEGHFIPNQRFGLTAGALGIYHLKDDLYQDRNTGLWHEINGTQGLTLNLTANAYVRFGRRGQIKLDVTGAAPVVRRDVYSSGLNRIWSVMPRFTFFFNSKKGSLMF
jgi:hypothetical protein